VGGAWVGNPAKQTLERRWADKTHKYNVFTFSQGLQELAMFFFPQKASFTSQPTLVKKNCKNETQCHPIGYS
jgi:hypothetical protein